MKRDPENIIKKDLLRKKLMEFFSQNKNRTSVIMSTNIGSKKTLWKATKLPNKQIHVIEVNSSKEKFFFKDEEDKKKDETAIVKSAEKEENPLDKAKKILQALPPAVLQKLIQTNPKLSKFLSNSKEKISESETLSEASVDFANATKMFMDAMANLADHNKLSAAHRQLNTMITKITNPDEKQQLGSMIGALIGAVDASTKGGGKVTVSTSQMPAAGLGMQKLTNSKKIKGKSLSESKKKDLKKNLKQIKTKKK